MKIKLLPLLLLLSMGTQAQKLTPNNIPQVVKGLSNEEKVDIVIGAGMFLDNLGPQVGTTEAKVPGAAATSIPNSRIGLPALVLADGPAGVRIAPKRDYLPGKTFFATGFPVATLLASSWDPALIENVGKAFGNESLEYGVDFLLAPALNIHRNPLGGRNFEYYSEDPILSGKMAASFVKGVQSQGVGTSIKHFAANNQETNRSKVDEFISERALREIYLKGFEIAVKEGNPWTVMSSYNKINGVYTSQRYDLLTTILRNEWGFKGLVMTDWFGGDNAVEQMKAGNELLMPGTAKQRQDLLEALKNGQLSQEVINKNVERILSIYVNTPSFKNYANSNNPDLDGHKSVARAAATQGMVLLKNTDQTLPLLSSSKVALFGNTAYHTIAGGTGSGDVNKAYTLSIYDGFKGTGYNNVDTQLGDGYFQFVKDEFAKIPPKAQFWEKDILPGEKSWNQSELDAIAKVNDVAILTIGRTSGEFQDRTEANDFELSSAEKSLLTALTSTFHAQGKKVIVVLNIGGVIETQSWKDMPDAVLLAWQPGQEAGGAVADVIYGKVNPSGKLPMSFPIKYSDTPSAKCFPGKTLVDTPATSLDILQGRPAEVSYEEDIYVGYRYYETFGVKTSFPFGFGLSYTTFKYDNLVVKKEKDTFKVTFKITNTGKAAGKEVAQLYISTKSGSIEKPTKELKAFHKTGLLQPGQSEIVAISIKPSDLASYYTSKASWIADKGSYNFLVGASVDDVKLTKSIELLNEIIVSKVTNQLTPNRAINTLHQ